MTSTEGILTSARYGKDQIRVFRVVRNGSVHEIVEYNVQVLLEGDIATSYTKADNSVVVATDSMKNITYYLAKVSPHVLTPEHFALHLGTHLVATYSHITKALVTVEKLRWSRIPVGTAVGQERPHPHSFIRDGEDKRIAAVEVEKSIDGALTGKVTGGIRDLLVLKSTGSSFADFVRDEYTTLAEVDDRVFSTAVDLSYTYSPFAIRFPADAKKLAFEVPREVADAEGVAMKARVATLDIFATDESESVQATLFKMGQRVVAENDPVQTVSYRLPNKHYVAVDMEYIGVDNTTPANAEVFMPIAAPRRKHMASYLVLSREEWLARAHTVGADE